MSSLVGSHFWRNIHGGLLILQYRAVYYADGDGLGSVGSGWKMMLIRNLDESAEKRRHACGACKARTVDSTGWRTLCRRGSACGLLIILPEEADTGSGGVCDGYCECVGVVGEKLTNSCGKSSARTPTASFYPLPRHAFMLERGVVKDGLVYSHYLL